MKALREFRDEPFETTRLWITVTLILGFSAVMVHVTAQTYFFTSSYFEEPNLYHVWPRIDEVTHALSSMALTAALCNFNLPHSLRRKWIVGLSLSFIFGLFWEAMEYLTAPYWGWIKISLSDTLLDLWQDLLGAGFAVLLYSHLVRKPGKFRMLQRRRGWSALGLNHLEKERGATYRSC
ncbi:MAG: hypothetical protein ACP5QI_07170 [Candidatus Bathyarchaeia archaeon]